MNGGGGSGDICFFSCNNNITSSNTLNILGIGQIGGQATNGSILSSVYFAKINSGGSIGGWKEE